MYNSRNGDNNLKNIHFLIGFLLFCHFFIFLFFLFLQVEHLSSTVTVGDLLHSPSLYATPRGSSKTGSGNDEITPRKKQTTVTAAEPR